jgi:hypothetical protein
MNGPPGKVANTPVLRCRLPRSAAAVSGGNCYYLRGALCCTTRARCSPHHAAVSYVRSLNANALSIFGQPLMTSEGTKSPASFIATAGASAIAKSFPALGGAS